MNFITIVLCVMMVFIFSSFLKASPVRSLLVLIMLITSVLSLVQLLLYKLRTSNKVTVIVNVLLVVLLGILLYFSVLYLHTH